MADYYSVVARAVAGLTPSTRQARREIYDRELATLLAQLREVRPALSKFNLTRERLEFEAAVRKLEDEQAIKQHEKIATLADIPKPSARLIPQTEESLRRQEEEAERLQNKVDPSRVRLTPQEEELVRRIQEKLDASRRQEE